MKEVIINTIQILVALSLLGVLLDRRNVSELWKSTKQAEWTIRCLNQSLVGTWEWNTKTQNILWSDSMFAIYGKTPPIESNWVDYDYWINSVHPEDRERMNRNIETAGTGGTLYNHQFRIITDSGDVRVIEGRGGYNIDKRYMSGVNILKGRIDDPLIKLETPFSQLYQEIITDLIEIREK